MTQQELKEYIIARVFPNNAQEITGASLQDALLAIVDNSQNEEEATEALARLATDISEIEDTVAQNTADIATKQETLTLTVKDNGNIVIGNLDGQTKEFMPATPSGVPEHYTWLKYNGVTYGTFTGADGNTYGQEGKWGVYAERGGLADLTNEDMRQVIVDSRQLATNNNAVQSCILARTNLIANANGLLISSYSFNSFLRASTKLEIANLILYSSSDAYFEPSNISQMFQQCPMLHTVLGTIGGRFLTNTTNCFVGCYALKEVRISGLKVSISFANSPLSVESATYLLQNADNTAQFTATFRADRQAIYEADADFMTAKNEKPNITILYQ